MRKLSAFVAVLPLLFSFVLSYFQVAPKDKGEKLSFNQNGEFIILFVGGLLEEKGFSEKGKGYLKSVIDEANPQLVILGGNNIMAQPIISDLFFAETMKIIDGYNAIFEEKEVYFSVLYGEWDNSSLFDKSAQLKRYMRSDYFVGGISNSESLQVLYNRKGALIGNFSINIYNNAILHNQLFIIDYQNGDENLEDKKNWLKSISDKPSIIFTNGQNYNFTDENTNFQFATANTMASFSSCCIESYEFWSDDILYATLPQSGKVQDGSVIYNYKAKKIVLAVDGGLFVEDI